MEQDEATEGYQCYLQEMMLIDDLTIDEAVGPSITTGRFLLFVLNDSISEWLDK